MILFNQLQRYEIVLASSSPRRQELLSGMGIRFKTLNSGVDESVPKGLSFPETASFLAEQKAKKVYEQHKKENLLVIGGDTIVVCENKLMGKPANALEAKQMLQKLANNKHHVITGISLVSSKGTYTRYDEAEVTFNALTDEEITYYINNYSPYDKAGAYGIQEWIGYRAVSAIKGSFYTIMGLPTHLLWEMLEEVAEDE